MVIGVPHVLQNNDHPSLNKSKAISFKHIYRTIKNFNQLCLSFENQPEPPDIPVRQPDEEEDSESLYDSSVDDSDDEDTEPADRPTKYFVKEKYRRLYDPQRTLAVKETEVQDKKPSLKAEGKEEQEQAQKA